MIMKNETVDTQTWMATKAYGSNGEWNISALPKNTDPSTWIAVARVLGEKAKEHAQLLAAVPDLLAACEYAYKHMPTSRDDSEQYTEALSMLSAAIQKAKGQS